MLSENVTSLRCVKLDTKKMKTSKILESLGLEMNVCLYICSEVCAFTRNMIAEYLDTLHDLYIRFGLLEWKDNYVLPSCTSGALRCEYHEFLNILDFCK